MSDHGRGNIRPLRKRGFEPTAAERSAPNLNRQCRFHDRYTRPALAWLRTTDRVPTALEGILSGIENTIISLPPRTAASC
jgi:hypothetical protein